VLKKAGIVVAAAATGLFALSPLAFAGESHKDWHHSHSAGSTDISSVERNGTGLVNVGDVNANAPVNAGNCIDGADALTSAPPVLGALGLLGLADSNTTNVLSNRCANTTGDSSVDGVNLDQD
jgi:hypothetical protein